MRKYFKTNHPVVVAARDQFNKESDELFALANIFASKFGGVPVYRYSIHGVEFGGLQFNPSKTDPLWTKADRESKIQRPRISLKKSTPEQRIELAALNDTWASSKGEMPRVSRDPILESLGTDWGNCLFSPFRLFWFGEFGWIETEQELNDRMVEIIASEFEESLGKYLAEKKKSVVQSTHTTAGQSHFFISDQVLSACCQVTRNLYKPTTPSASGGFVCDKCYLYSQSLQSIGEIS